MKTSLRELNAAVFHEFLSPVPCSLWDALGHRICGILPLPPGLGRPCVVVVRWCVPVLCVDTRHEH